MLEVAIIGGGARGRSYLALSSAFGGKMRVVAVCDPSDDASRWWRSHAPGVRLFRDLGELLAWDGFDAAIVASPVPLHSAQSIELLRAGKHVLSEVPAALTLEDCWRLIDAVKESGRLYMMGENYCYMRQCLMVLNMVEKGVFGETVYAEGGYIHDVRNLFFTEGGELTWRGEPARTCAGNPYPTHSVGPVALWLGVNRGDRFVRMATFRSRSASIAKYVAEVYGSDHPGARREFWALPDTTVSILETRGGALAVIRVDLASPRPHNVAHYHLQGTKASYISGRSHGEEPLVWIEGRSPGRSPGDASWEPLYKYSREYEHPLWRMWGGLAKRYGHGGDFLMLNDFLAAVEEGGRPLLDVYDAVTWSAVIPLSEESVKGGAHQSSSRILDAASGGGAVPFNHPRRCVHREQAGLREAGL